APAGTMINGGTFMVPPALGNKIIRPFSDFLLHDIGTGDGIVENGGMETRNKIRTVPLWGLRTRTLFMHDGLSLTVNDAILRHAGEAKTIIKKYRRLPDTQKQQLLTFLKSL
ncbi:MAG: thiol oxidoreductase-like protein, partial [bacterium]